MDESSSSSQSAAESAPLHAVKKYQYIIFESHDHTSRVSEIVRSKIKFNSYELATLRALSEVARQSYINKGSENIHYRIECVDESNSRLNRVYADRVNLLDCLLNVTREQLVHLIGDELVDCELCSKNCAEPACYDHIINSVKNLDIDVLHHVYVMNIFHDYKIYAENDDLVTKKYVEEWLNKNSTIKLLRRVLYNHCAEHSIEIENKDLNCLRCIQFPNAKYNLDSDSE